MVMEFWIVTVNSVGLIPLLYIVGAPCNILCIAVFYRLGLRDRINVCLFALALVDLLTITIIFLQSVEEGYRKLIACTNFIIRYLVGLTGFTWASQFVSTVITCERCFCVVSPFKAQRYLKTSTMAAIIAVVCFILVGGMCAVAGHKYVSLCTKGPAISDSGKSTYFTEYYLDNKRILDIIDIFIYATAFPIIILVINVIATAVTTVKVRHAAAWRLHSANNNLTPPHGPTGAGQVRPLCQGSGPHQDAHRHFPPLHRLSDSQRHGADRHLPRQRPQLRRQVRQHDLRPVDRHFLPAHDQLLAQLLCVPQDGLQVQGDSV
ncbi:uncharacterized protein LOC112571230 [Pomacea canaliculata]|uniref:uncharacterized protein LOC112571230 n=1 Tax=Pomacea canaliculata TaxID=400727 RepID=UPI000D72709A|nr:uncharacterized protein LOC112571230 [Pomacea canaliculata]